MKFSDRLGYTKASEKIQFEGVDLPLRNRLWSLLDLYYWDLVAYDRSSGGYFLRDVQNADMQKLCLLTWHNYYKEPLDTLSRDWLDVRKRFRDDFFDHVWYSVLNFIEWVANVYPAEKVNANFIAACNKVLEEEMSAYRFVSGRITPISDTKEMASIDEAAKSPDQAVSEHLKKSLEMLSDRQNPDYRNSIKEAISAVEALAIKVTGQKATLGQLVKKLDEHVPVHGALKGAFDKLYGYTSDEEGVRHALMEQEKVDFEDAKFMLVTCSAFINYVRSKLK
jgi:hypothetical protein